MANRIDDQGNNIENSCESDSDLFTSESAIFDISCAILNLKIRFFIFQKSFVKLALRNIQSWLEHYM